MYLAPELSHKSPQFSASKASGLRGEASSYSTAESLVLRVSESSAGQRDRHGNIVESCRPGWAERRHNERPRALVRQGALDEALRLMSRVGWLFRVWLVPRVVQLRRMEARGRLSSPKAEGSCRVPSCPGLGISRYEHWPSHQIWQPSTHSLVDPSRPSNNLRPRKSRMHTRALDTVLPDVKIRLARHEGEAGPRSRVKRCSRSCSTFVMSNDLPTATSWRRLGFSNNYLSVIGLVFL